VPLTFLQKYPTFGQNKIYLLNGFTPTHYVAVNPLVIQQSADSINALDCTKWIAREFMPLIDGAMPIYKTGARKFHTTPPKAYEGFTVTFVSLQIAYWLGFRRVLLVGIDHRYQYEGKPNAKTIWEGADVNHFHPDYFRGQEWNNPDLAKSEIYYRMAREAYAGEVYNLTPNTGLDVFKKGDTKEWQ